MNNDSLWIVYVIGVISGIVITMIIKNIIPGIRSRILAAKEEKDRYETHPQNIENDIALRPAKAIVRTDYSGAVYKRCVSEGTLVKEGDVVLVFETMKLEMDIKAPTAGFIKFYRDVGEACSTNDLLFAII